MKRILPIFLAVMLLFAACASAPDAPDGDLRERFLAGANAVVVTDDAVTFPDDSGSGEPVTLAKNPANPAILYASFVTLWCEAGGIPSGIVGGSSAKELYREVIGRDITADAGVTVLADSAMAKRWDIESILAAQPDVIFCSAAMSGYATISAPAKAAGIPVAAVDYDDFADYLKWFKVFCHLSGHPELWETIALPTLDAVLDIIAGTSGKTPPRVLCLFTGEDSLRANTPETVVGAMLAQLGAKNVIPADAGDRPDVNLETIYAAAPDVILVQCHTGTDDARALVERLVGENPVWQSLEAVRAGRVFYLDKTLFHNKPNRRFAEAYAMLAKMLYE
ncbi:MAG: ABC transporter substrate-binding protein [Clostridia bacterium]|nr:ABC transporter substrate-binding protein [Clostridia bacterium]